SGIGQTLREARAGRGIELDEAERVTKIRIKYLRAMEEDRWEVLPGDAVRHREPLGGGGA
ncbi:MAG: helix-turn-helix domain-containing protein, partial [Solirubrobacterales bacterium]